MIDFWRQKKNRCRFYLPLFLAVFLLFSIVTEAESAEILVVGDNRLKPVVQVIEGIKKEVSEEIRIYKPKEIRGRLDSIVKQYEIQTVIALGGDSISEALSLPTSVTVLYALTILPPEKKRPNTAGFYIGTPVKKYVKFISDYLPEIENIVVIGTPKILEILDRESSPLINTYKVEDVYDYVETIKGLDADALLLLPDISLMTKTAVEESYLFSFRQGVPLLGISQKYVRQGALFALEFDPEAIGRRLGKMAQTSMDSRETAEAAHMPPEHYKLYVNQKTARKMGITIPEEMLKQAEAVYP